jgi:hypothetical protein
VVPFAGSIRCHSPAASGMETLGRCLRAGPRRFYFRVRRTDHAQLCRGKGAEKTAAIFVDVFGCFDVSIGEPPSSRWVGKPARTRPGQTTCFHRLHDRVRKPVASHGRRCSVRMRGPGSPQSEPKSILDFGFVLTALGYHCWEATNSVLHRFFQSGHSGVT